MIAFGRKLSVDRWPIALLILLPGVLLAPIVIFGRVLYWGVPLLQFYPWQQAAAGSLQAGQLPLWNSLVGSGAPLAANLQTGAFYPLNFLYLLLPTEYAMDYTAALHVILAGLFMFAFMRTLGLKPVAALIAAIAFQLCGFLISRLSFFSVTAAFPWIAAWLWRAEKLVFSTQQSVVSRRLPSVSHILWLALVIGLGILAGHAQTAIYGLIFVGAYVLWRVTSLLRHSVTVSPRQRAALLLLSFAVALLLGLGLASIQLLPAAELTRESQRAGGLDYTQIMTHSYWPPRLVTLLSPDFFGNPAQNNFWGYDNYWENAAYIGVIPLLLALWVMGQSVSRSMGRLVNRSPVSNPPALTGFFTLSAIIALVLAFGWFTPIYPWLYRSIPGFALLQGPARWLVVVIPALCALAGFGAQRLIDHGFSRRAAARLILLGVALSIGGLAAGFILRGHAATFGPATLRFGLLLVVAGFVFRSKIQNPKPQIMLMAVVAIDLLTAHFLLNPVLEPAIYHGPNPTAAAIKADGQGGRLFYFAADEEAIKFDVYLAHDKTFDGYGPNDLNYWLGARQALLPNAAMIDRLPSANNFDSLIIGRYQNLLDKVNSLPFDQALPLLNRMNVSYIVSPRSLDLPVVFRTRDVTIYRNGAALPRTFIAPADRDLAQADAIVPGSSIESLTDSGNAVTIRASSPSAGWLILSDVWYPGWQATLDGAATPIQIANEAFRAIYFPAGAHEVVFRYEPASVTAGEWITLACVLLVVIGLVATNTCGAVLP